MTTYLIPPESISVQGVGFIPPGLYDQWRLSGRQGQWIEIRSKRDGLRYNVHEIDLRQYQTTEDKPMEQQFDLVTSEPAPMALNLSPQEQVERGSEMAKVLKQVVDQANLSQRFGKKEHLMFEAWQTIGRFFQCTPVTEWTKPIKDGDTVVGWESRVQVVDERGMTIGAAESMCATDEKNWKNRHQYAIRSMAQTRAAGKALRSVFAWVAVLGGYSPTPAEEMDASMVDPKQSGFTRGVPTGDSKPRNLYITESQRKKIFVELQKLGCSRDEMSAVMRWYQTEVLGLADDERISRAAASDIIENIGQIVEQYQADQDLPV